MAKNMLTNLNLNKNELQNMVLQPLATAPSDPKNGQMYYDTADKAVKIYDGSATPGTWKVLGEDGVQTVAAKNGEYIVAVNADDPKNPKLYVNIATTQGDGVTVTQVAPVEGSENGGIKVAVQDGTTLQKGIVGLTSTPSSTDEGKAATPKGANVTLEALETATEGYLKTYEIKQGGTSVGKIDIPMDFLVKEAAIGTVTAEDKAAGGKFSDETKYGDFLVGDLYIDLKINVKSGTATDEHIYILCKKLGKFPYRSTSSIAAGDTTATITLPAGSTFMAAYATDADGDMVICDIKVTDATSAAAGSVVFTIASAYTEAISVAASYIA